MSRCSRTIAFAALSIAWGCLSAHADSLRCQSVNGNLNCVGSNGVACQTIDGKKVCVSGHGDVVQTFGNGHAGDGGMDGAPPVRPWMKDRPHRWTDMGAGPDNIDPDWPSDSDE